MLISPTEPPTIKKLGAVSSQPERYGSDILIASKHGLVGIQRKEITDLVASVHDGRLSMELSQMQQLSIGVLIIEGKINWSRDGILLNCRSEWTRANHQGLLFTVQSKGCWTLSSSNMDETCTLTLSLQRWLQKEKHNSLNTRPKVKGQWGYATSREWGVHLLQSFPGIGPETAGAIFDEFGGVPLQWVVEEMDLQMVPGVGVKRARSLIASLNHQQDKSTESHK